MTCIPANRLRRHTAGNAERGTSVVNTILIITVVLLIAELVIVGGRIAGAHAAVSNAAREAARQGTLVQTEAQVYPTVLAAAKANLAANGQNCEPASVIHSGTDFNPGQWVRVKVSCSVNLSELSGFGIWLPNVSISATHQETLETYRAFGVVNTP